MDHLLVSCTSRFDLRFANSFGMPPLQTTDNRLHRLRLNIGGLSDSVFNVVSSFLESDTNRFVREVEVVEL